VSVPAGIVGRYDITSFGRVSKMVKERLIPGVKRHRCSGAA
jgi:hypothetical protein